MWMKPAAGPVWKGRRQNDNVSSLQKGGASGPPGGDPVQAAVSAAPTGGLLVTVPRELEYPVNQSIEVVFYDPLMGVVHCLCTLSSPIITDDHLSRSYRCNILERLSQEQRREDIKVPLSVRVEITLNDQQAPATVDNISAGGVHLTTTLAARVNDRFTFEFPEAGLSVPLVAQVLRVECHLDRRHQPVFGYGCRFVDLPPRQEAALRSYVFKADRQRYQ